jgi:hypothetical protein
MSHLAVIIREIAARGATTYAKLLRKYEAHGYNYEGFTAAVHRGRKLGVLSKHGTVITAAGDCPMCGRKL